MTFATLVGLLMPTIERRKVLSFQYQFGTKQGTVLTVTLTVRSTFT